jgi:hypothetical protein
MRIYNRLRILILDHRKNIIQNINNHKRKRKANADPKQAVNRYFI